MFEPTSFKTEGGANIDRPQCEFFNDWDADNTASVDVNIPAQGGTYTQPCDRLLVGPRKSCGLAIQTDTTSCTPGQTVTLSCSVADATNPQVVRMCERSVKLGVPIPCGYFDSLATEVVAGATSVELTCPQARDSIEVGGTFVTYGMPLVSSSAAQPVTCVVQ
jgi:hypothetical protein